ncbi:MAG: CYTH domain-containing protein [Lentisphaeria bacterium]|nr:CYTH domain-containing protein [Lentisphaeria bacterium]
MPVETERKFLVKNADWRGAAVSRSRIRQGYAHFRGDPRLTFRIRLTDNRAFLTLKGPVSGCSRSEYEYPVPAQDAEEILKEFCEEGQIEKYRYRVPFGKHVWEVDEFLGRNTGLVLAEVELDSPEEEPAVPGWIGREVTGEVRFYNSRLLDYPYQDWKPEERL